MTRRRTSLMMTLFVLILAGLALPNILDHPYPRPWRTYIEFGGLGICGVLLAWLLISAITKNLRAIPK